MVDTNSPEFQLGKKFGHLLMTYVGIRIVIKGTKLVIKHGSALLGVGNAAPVSTP